jgi:ectoine hydroxylase-related dioxygenase (phytanoyl-CoA dioxygenase family)
MTMGAEKAVSDWEKNGYFRVREFLSHHDCDRLIEAAQHIIQEGHNAIVRYEGNLPETLPKEQRVSKLYRFHRAEPFCSLVTSPSLINLIRPLMSGDFDVFFPFEPTRPVVAVWIALTEATESNSCLRVVPGSHKAEVAPHGRDQGAATAGRYVSLVDQDVAAYTSLVMSPGDLVVFDSHLAHSSGDNLSTKARIALCFHFATSGTIDRTAEVFGSSPYNDWMPAWRTNG